MIVAKVSVPLRALSLYSLCCSLCVHTVTPDLKGMRAYSYDMRFSSITHWSNIAADPWFSIRWESVSLIKHFSWSRRFFWPHQVMVLACCFSFNMRALWCLNSIHFHSLNLTSHLSNTLENQPMKKSLLPRKKRMMREMSPVLFYIFFNTSCSCMTRLYELVTIYLFIVTIMFTSEISKQYERRFEWSFVRLLMSYRKTSNKSGNSIDCNVCGDFWSSSWLVFW